MRFTDDAPREAIVGVFAFPAAASGCGFAIDENSLKLPERTFLELTDPLLADPQLMTEILERGAGLRQVAPANDDLLTIRQFAHCGREPAGPGLGVEVGSDLLLGRRALVGNHILPFAVAVLT